jgi:hypothetical protein
MKHARFSTTVRIFSDEDHCNGEEQRDYCGLFDSRPRNAAVEAQLTTGGLGREFAGLFTKVGIESDIPDLRGHTVKPFEFDS